MPDSTSLVIGAGEVAILRGVNPPVLFFFLGALGALAGTKLSIPKAATKLMSLFLLWAIGFRGGVELSHSGMTGDLLKAAGIGLVLAVLIPVWAYAGLRRLPGVGPANAAAISACYGSVSVVTFLVACSSLEQRGTPYSGHMTAVMALMEAPGILIALLLLGMERGSREEGMQRPPLGEVLHEALFNGPVVLLLGSIAVGLLTGQRGYEVFKPLCTDAFPGVLAFFLLDLGLLAARRARSLLSAPKAVIAFGVLAPLLHAAVALVAACWFGLSPGDGTLLATLAASASYIAAPAALRLAVPRADAGLYVPLSLAVTFPFNVVAGVPLYAAAAQWLLS